MRFKNPTDRGALALLSKDELIDLVLSLAVRLDELERRFGLNSSNSGKPPAGKKKRRRTGSLREKSGGHGVQQVFDLPEPRPLRQTRAAFPDGVTDPVQYGARIGAMVLYLQHYQLLPEDRLAELLGDSFGLALVPATVVRMGRSRARRIAGVVEAIRELVKAAPVKHMDETSLRVGGQTQWLHVASTAGLTF